MLKVTYKSKSKGPLERAVRAKMDQITALWDELEDFERLFKLEMGRMPQNNHICAQHAFRLRTNGENEIAVWHFTPDGNQDRLMAVINYEPEIENLFL